MRRILLPVMGLLLLYSCSGKETPQEPEPDSFVLFRTMVIVGVSGDTLTRHYLSIAGASMDSIPEVWVNGFRFPDTSFGFEMFIVGASMDTPAVRPGDTVRVSVGFKSIAGKYIEGYAMDVVPSFPALMNPVERNDTVYLSWFSSEWVDGYALSLHSWCSDTAYNHYDYHLDLYLRDKEYGILADSICPYDSITDGAIDIYLRSIRGPIFYFGSNFGKIDGRLLVESQKHYRLNLPLGD